MSSSESRARDVHTPANVPLSPSQHRTPSILRTLAHHPSLSALKSRSRRGKAKSRSAIPPMPIPDESLGIVASSECQAMDGAESPSPKKLRRKGSLKASRSLPRDMRLSGEFTRSSADSRNTPPVPSPPVGNSEIGRTKKLHKREMSTISMIRRKPVPSPEPSITLQAPDLTPETVRVRRMRFQFDLSMDDSPTKSRRRAVSHGAVDVSPEKRSPSRHLSTPAHPSPFGQRGQYASHQHPFTTQHPHPVPLTLSPSTHKADTFYTCRDIDGHKRDEAPWAEFGILGEADQVLGDGLDLLVQQEEIPVGTPGGKKTDLRRGVLLDGAKHEKNAVRYFSRDMYAPTESSSRSATPSLTPLNARISLDKQDKRSSSPFEVKLSPLVSKRISLDAFGLHSPLSTSDAVSPPAGIEGEALVEDESDTLLPTQEDEVESLIRDTSLSTIGEQHSDDGHEWLSNTDATLPGTVVERTNYFTPSMTSTEDDMPDTPPDSPWIPQRARHHNSAPPLSITQAMFNAHGQSSLALQVEIETARTVIQELELENELLRARLQSGAVFANGDEMDDKQRERVDELENVLKDKEKELEGINQQIRQQAEEHGLTVSQLRNALSENEGFFDALQQAHDDYAEQLTELRDQHAQLTFERAQDATTLHDLAVECGSLRQQMAKSDKERIQAETDVVDLQKTLHELEFQLSTITDEHVKATRQHDDVLLSLHQRFDEKEERVTELEDLLKAGLGREIELQKAHQQLEHKDQRIAELQRVQMDEQALIDRLNERLGDNDAELKDTKGQMEIIQNGKNGLENDLKAALRSTTAKDSIIGVLREKLRTMGFERDELVANRDLQEDANREVMAQLKEEILSEREAVERQEEQVTLLMGELNGAHEEVKSLAEKLDEREADLEELNNFVENLEAGQAALDQEKDELLDLLDRSNGDESSISSLRVQLTSARSQLATAMLNAESLTANLEDAKASLETRLSTLRLQDDELDFLRNSLAEREEEASVAAGDIARKAREAERRKVELLSEVEELKENLVTKDARLSQAIINFEMEKATSADLKSRLDAYTSELDRLQLDTATSKIHVDDAKRDSAALEIKVVELEKRIESLESDKELLNVALDSKRTELVLLQRQLGVSTPKKHTQALAASTSRIGYRSSMIGGDITPVPNRKLSTSLSYTATSKGRRASVTTPNSTLHAGSTPRGKTPLGGSTRHNRTPDAARRSMKAGDLTKRTNLPVLKGRNSADLGRGRPVSKAEVTKVDEVDEVVGMESYL